MKNDPEREIYALMGQTTHSYKDGSISHLKVIAGASENLDWISIQSDDHGEFVMVNSVEEIEQLTKLLYQAAVRLEWIDEIPAAIPVDLSVPECLREPSQS